MRLNHGRGPVGAFLAKVCSQDDIDLIDQMFEQGATVDQIALMHLYVQHPPPQQLPPQQPPQPPPQQPPPPPMHWSFPWVLEQRSECIVAPKGCLFLPAPVFRAC